MSYPVGYYTSYTPIKDAGSPLDQLCAAFGYRLEKLTKLEKFSLLASIAIVGIADCTNEDCALIDAYHETEGALVREELFRLLPELDTLSGSDLLGLCEAIVTQLKSEVS